MTATQTAVVTRPVDIAAIHERIEYARLSLLQRLLRRPPAGWGGIRRNAPPRPMRVDDYHDALDRVLTAAPKADPRLEPCARCGFSRDEHWRTGVNHCPGGDPDDTFTEGER